MAETEKQRIARSYIAGALSLLDGMDRTWGGIVASNELTAPLELLDLARATLDAKDEKREAKNARDRERRAKPKTKPKKSKPKKGKGWGAALTGGELDS